MWCYNDPYVYLCHFGIKGQKWGIRRYQNYDGTYTQAGLIRYNKAQAAYDAARASGDKAAIKQAKGNRDKEYKKLKNDYLADKGKELYKSGHTINEGEMRTKLATTAALAVSAYSFKKMAEAGAGFYTSRKAELTAHIVPATVAVGSAALAGVMNYTQSDRKRKLRAYYGH